jgi:hypothetical protein
LVRLLGRCGKELTSPHGLLEEGQLQWRENGKGRRNEGLLESREGEAGKGRTWPVATGCPVVRDMAAASACSPGLAGSVGGSN